MQPVSRNQDESITVMGGPSEPDDFSIDEVESYQEELRQYRDSTGVPVHDEVDNPFADDPFGGMAMVEEPDPSPVVAVDTVMPSPGGSFVLPPGYVMVPESTYRRMEQRITSLEDRIVQNTGAAKVLGQSEPGPVIRLRALREFILGDINQKIRVGSELEWVPNGWLKIGGQKFNKLDSFLTFFNLQNPAHPLFNTSIERRFEVLNPDVFAHYFPRASQYRGAGQVAPPQTAPISRNELPPVGSQERKNIFLNRPPVGNAGLKGGVLSVPGVNPNVFVPAGAEVLPVVRANARGATHGMREVSKITGANAAQGGVHPLASMMMQTARSGVTGT